MPLFPSLLAASIAIVLAVSTARADTRVVLLEGGAAHLPSLGAQLELHLGPSTPIERVPRQPTSVSELAAITPTVLADHGAALVVWIDARQSDSGQVYVVYVAGRLADRAIVELVRLPARTPPGEVERTIALKVAALLDTMIETPAGAALGVPDTSARWSVGLGGRVTLDAHDRGFAGGPALLLEHVRGGASWRIGAALVVRWEQAAAIETPIARASIHELAGTLGASAQRQWGRWALDAHAHAGAAWFHARGEAGTSRRGAADAWVPIAGLGVGPRLYMSDRAWIMLSIDLDCLLIRQRFVVDEEVAADLGRFRLAFGLTLANSL